jgi:hypothetical protein
VSFAVTPAARKPKLTNVVTRVLRSKSGTNLDSRFEDEDEDMDKMEWSFENLEAPIGEQADDEDREKPFSPSAVQWNSLIHQVQSLTSELKTTREALTILAELSEDRFETVDGQVTNLRGSTGSRPRKLGPCLPALDLWTNVAKLAEEVADAQESLNHPKPTGFDTLPRSLVVSAQNTANKQASTLSVLGSTKAEYVGQVKPLEAVLNNMSLDLYSPEGAYNKALMNRALSGQGESSKLQTQVELHAIQLKELTGSDFGGKAVDINDPAITALKADVATLLNDNRTIKATA